VSEMIERVARAICKSRFLDSGTGDDGWDDASPEIRCDYRAEARAAIEAIREPTDAMVERAVGEFSGYPRAAIFRAIFIHMIDAVLAEPPA
jgi:hypothetical protein